jgi:hypothetical protein
MSRVKAKRSESVLLAATLILCCVVGPMQAAVIVGDPADANIEYRSALGTYTVRNPTEQDAHIGNRSNNVDAPVFRKAVFVFQLAEERPENFRVSSASSLQFRFAGGDNFPLMTYSTDLYGLRWSSSNTVLTNDYFSGPNLLQSGIITTATAFPSTVTTDESGSAKLGAWLNSVYEQGAGAGDYVFLQLSYSSTPPLGSFNSYRVDLASNSTEANRPILTLDFTPLPEPTTAVMVLLGAGSLLWLRRVRTV